MDFGAIEYWNPAYAQGRETAFGSAAVWHSSYTGSSEGDFANCLVPTSCSLIVFFYLKQELCVLLGEDSSTQEEVESNSSEWFNSLNSVQSFMFSWGQIIQPPYPLSQLMMNYDLNNMRCDSALVPVAQKTHFWVLDLDRITCFFFLNIFQNLNFLVMFLVGWNLDPVSIPSPHCTSPLWRAHVFGILTVLRKTPS